MVEDKYDSERGCGGGGGGGGGGGRGSGGFREFLLSSSFPLSPSNPELGEYNEGGLETKEKLCSYLH